MDVISTPINVETRRMYQDQVLDQNQNQDQDEILLVFRLKECISKGLYPVLVHILCVNKFSEDILKEAFELAKHSTSSLNNVMCGAINAKMMSYSNSNSNDWEIVEDDWEIVKRVHNMGRPITSITGYTYYVN
jgi:hypothetical protein